MVQGLGFEFKGLVSGSRLKSPTPGPTSAVADACRQAMVFSAVKSSCCWTAASPHICMHAFAGVGFKECVLDDGGDSVTEI